MDLFWKGFEKQGNLFKRFGKGKNIVVVGERGSTSASNNPNMMRLVMQRSQLQPLIKLVSKIDKMPFAKAKRELREVLLGHHRNTGSSILGTIAPGRKGKRLYLNRGVFSEKKRLNVSPREFVNHEAFHAFAPAGLGHSEILAHAYGGLKRKKGTLSPLGGLKSVGHAFKTRPVRASGEALLAAGAGIGITKGVGSLKNKLKQTQEPYEESPVLEKGTNKTKVRVNKSTTRP